MTKAGKAAGLTHGTSLSNRKSSLKESYRAGRNYGPVNKDFLRVPRPSNISSGAFSSFQGQHMEILTACTRMDCVPHPGRRSGWVKVRRSQIRVFTRLQDSDHSIDIDAATYPDNAFDRPSITGFAKGD
jgi:hypothetical protein